MNTSVYTCEYMNECVHARARWRTYVCVVNAMLRVTPSAPFKSPAAHSI